MCSIPDILLMLAISNSVPFVMMGIDKRRAKQRRWRISEAALLGTSALLGGAGGLAGMMLFRHKTRKAKFRIGMPLILLGRIALLLAIVWL